MSKTIRRQKSEYVRRARRQIDGDRWTRNGWQHTLHIQITDPDYNEYEPVSTAEEGEEDEDTQHPVSR